MSTDILMYASIMILSLLGGFGGSGYSAGRDRGAGRWQVISRGGQSVLLLAFRDGGRYEYTLSMEEGATYLNGERYYRTYSDSPVESGRPRCR